MSLNVRVGRQWLTLSLAASIFLMLVLGESALAQKLYPVSSVEDSGVSIGTWALGCWIIIFLSPCQDLPFLLFISV